MGRSSAGSGLPRSSREDLQTRAGVFVFRRGAATEGRRGCLRDAPASFPTQRKPKAAPPTAVSKIASPSELLQICAHERLDTLGRGCSTLALASGSRVGCCIFKSAAAEQTDCGCCLQRCDQTAYVPLCSAARNRLAEESCCLVLAGETLQLSRRKFLNVDMNLRHDETRTRPRVSAAVEC